MEFSTNPRSAKPLHNYLRAFIDSDLSADTLIEATGRSECEIAAWFEGALIPKECLEEIFARAFHANLSKCQKVGLAIVEEPRLIREEAFLQCLASLKEVRYQLLGHRFARSLGMLPWSEGPELGGLVQVVEPRWLAHSVECTQPLE